MASMVKFDLWVDLLLIKNLGTKVNYYYLYTFRSRHEPQKNLMGLLSDYYSEKFWKSSKKEKKLFVIISLSYFFVDVK